MTLTLVLLLLGLAVAFALSGGLIVWAVAPVRPAPPSGRGTGRRVLTILAVGALAAGAISLFTPDRHASTPPPPKPMAKMSARTLQRHAAESGIFGGAAAGQKALAAELKGLGPTVPVSTTVAHPDGPSFDEPRPGMAVRVLRVRSSTPHFSREKALADAVLVARDRLAERLAALDPPVQVVPSFDVIQRDYVRPESVTDVLPTQAVKDDWKAAGLGENRQWVEIDVEVSDRQLRELRSKERATDGGIVAGAMAVAFAALFGFLRLDAWTKGYLTTALAFAAAGVVGGAVALLAWVR